MQQRSLNLSSHRNSGRAWAEPKRQNEYGHRATPWTHTQSDKAAVKQLFNVWVMVGGPHPFATRRSLHGWGVVEYSRSTKLSQTLARLEHQQFCVSQISQPRHADEQSMFRSNDSGALPLRTALLNSCARTDGAILLYDYTIVGAFVHSQGARQPQPSKGP